MTGPETDRNPDVRFERTDVDATSLLKAGFVIVAVTTAVLFFLVWLYGVFVRQEASRQPAPPVMKVDPAQMTVPPPVLQTAPAQDLAAFRAQEDEILGRYGWVDKERGIVRIPIGRAMSILAERGLPSPAPAPKPGGTP